MVTEIKVDGMECPHCAAKVKKVSEAVANVTSAEVNLEDGKAVITHDNAEINDILEAINAAGFTSYEL